MTTTTTGAADAPTSTIFGRVHLGYLVIETERTADRRRFIAKTSTYATVIAL